MEKIKPASIPVLFVFLILFLMLSCSGPQLQQTQPRGIYHLVKKNETIWAIARAYRVNLKDLAESNNITDINTIKEGSVIFIPNASQVINDIAVREKAATTATDIKDKKDGSDHAKKITGKDGEETAKEVIPAPVVIEKKEAPPVTPFPKTQKPKVAFSEEIPPSEVTRTRKTPGEKVTPLIEEKIQTDKNSFIWPVRGTVKSNFGIQPNKTNNNWIKIVARKGTKVKAAAAGTVIFSSPLQVFGETIIIRHKNNFSTVYTHLKKRYAPTDKYVKKGEPIALLGETDDDGDSYINFEIRFKGKARNPLQFLP